MGNADVFLGGDLTMEENAIMDAWETIINDFGKKVFTSDIPDDTNFEPETKPSQTTATPSVPSQRTVVNPFVGIDIGHLDVDFDKLSEEFKNFQSGKKLNETSTFPKYVVPTSSVYTERGWKYCGVHNEEKEKVHIPVRCVDNTGLEDKLMVGFSYFALNWASASNDLIEVELDSGETISVFSDRFELECKSTLAEEYMERRIVKSFEENHSSKCSW